MRLLVLIVLKEARGSWKSSRSRSDGAGGDRGVEEILTEDLTSGSEDQLGDGNAKPAAPRRTTCEGSQRWCSSRTGPKRTAKSSGRKNNNIGGLGCKKLCGLKKPSDPGVTRGVRVCPSGVGPGSGPGSGATATGNRRTPLVAEMRRAHAQNFFFREDHCQSRFLRGRMHVLPPSRGPRGSQEHATYRAMCAMGAG